MLKNEKLNKLIKYLKKEKIKKILNIYKFTKYNGKIELCISPQHIKKYKSLDGLFEILPEEFNDTYELIKTNLFNINFEIGR